MEEDRFSRRRVVQAGAGLAVGLAAARLTGADAAEAVQRLEPPRALDLRQRLLLRGGTIISMDPKVGDFAKGDVLIEGKTIRGVGANLSASGATVIDASNMILIPGLIDCHRHS
jgi:5-methylthioadenosine/S-adenosylhomocysteine deaminase